MVFKKISFLKKQSPDQFIHDLINVLDKNVLEAYVFGSFNTKDFNADSDLDLLLVVETNLKFHKRSEIVPGIIQFLSARDIPCDLIIYTPSEFKDLQDEGKNSSVGFWADFVKTSRKIFSARPDFQRSN